MDYALSFFVGLILGVMIILFGLVPKAVEAGVDRTVRTLGGEVISYNPVVFKLKDGTVLIEEIK